MPLPLSVPEPLATAPEAEPGPPDAPVDPGSPLVETPSPDETLPEPTEVPLVGSVELPVAATTLPALPPLLVTTDPDAAVDFPELFAPGVALEQAPTKASAQTAPRGRKGNRTLRIRIDSSPQSGARGSLPLRDLQTSHKG
jgi:hypothetical protein